ncbi:hypothetical protein D4S03_02485 [bacterium]|nr:MAG: hypothetical protein D4S03_02485 [bacterium]
MTTSVYRESGDRITLDPNDAIGTGGEGSVFPDPTNPKSVIKIYENPTKSHERKLKAFIAKHFQLPKNVAAPESLIFNRSGDVIGYTMAFMKGTKAFRELSNKNFRTRQKINNKLVVALHLNDAKVLEAIHRQNIVVGDRNDQNILFSGTESFYIDFDSVQFDTWPCPVATENYLDPALYSIDLTLKPVFLPQHDWYSYAVMLFRSLLLVHPYGGTHPKVNELTGRAIKRIPVFDPGVIYPAVGLPPDLISDELLHVFNKFFKDGWRGTFPQTELSKFQSVLIECPSCHAAFPGSKRACPVCKKQNQIVTAVSIPGSLTVKQLFGVKGQVLYHHLDGENLILITLEDNRAVMHIVNQSNTLTVPLFPYQVGMRFESSSKLLAVNIAGSDQIDLYEISYDEIKQIESCVSDTYAITQNAIMRVNGSHLFRLVGSQLVDTEVNKGVLLNRPIRSTIEHQSWFSVSSETSPTIVGFYRVLRQQFFWMHRDGFSADLPLPSLDLGESLIDLTVKYSGSSFLIIRKTKLKGEEFIRFDAYDKKGVSLYSTKTEAKKLPSDSIHGQAYAAGKLIFPTDTGAIRYDPVTGSRSEFSATSKVINSSQALFVYSAGLLVIDPKFISYITLN